MSTIKLAEVNERAVALLLNIARGPASAIRAALEPTPDDYADVFVGDAAKRAAEGYAGFWLNPPAMLSRPIHAEMRVFTQFSEELAASPNFPGGYRRISHLLAPGHVWCVFKFYGTSDTNGLAYNGLVARGERWAWFPKPWRVLGAQAEDIS